MLYAWWAKTILSTTDFRRKGKFPKNKICPSFSNLYQINPKQIPCKIKGIKIIKFYQNFPKILRKKVMSS